MPYMGSCQSCITFGDPAGQLQCSNFVCTANASDELKEFHVLGDTWGHSHGVGPLGSQERVCHYAGVKGHYDRQTELLEQSCLCKHFMSSLRSRR